MSRIVVTYGVPDGTLTLNLETDSPLPAGTYRLFGDLCRSALVIEAYLKSQEVQA